MRKMEQENKKRPPLLMEEFKKGQGKHHKKVVKKERWKGRRNLTRRGSHYVEAMKAFQR